MHFAFLSSTPGITRASHQRMADQWRENQLSQLGQPRTDSPQMAQQLINNRYMSASRQN